MKNLFDTATVTEVQTRLQKLRPETPRLWGKMSAAQAVAHLSVSLETALGDARPPRMLIGRAIGRFIKPLAIGDDKPMKKNAPTPPSFVVSDPRELEVERKRLSTLISRFAQAGPAGCTTHPHAFFGRLRPQEWAVLMYKHLDHHLRQFGV
jgi:Protein of unknown function (DUF1569)